MSLCRCTATASPWERPSPFPAQRVTTSPAPSKSPAYPQVSLLCRPLFQGLFWGVFGVCWILKDILVLHKGSSLFVSAMQVHLITTKECICKSPSVTNYVTYSLPLTPPPKGSGPALPPGARSCAAPRRPRRSRVFSCGRPTRATRAGRSSPACRVSGCLVNLSCTALPTEPGRTLSPPVTVRPSPLAP